MSLWDRLASSNGIRAVVGAHNTRETGSGGERREIVGWDGMRDPDG